MKGFSLNLRGRLVEFRRPAVMAIINATPDSFYSGARNGGQAAIEDALAQGADMIDIGGYSSRPSAPEVSVDEEWRRVGAALQAARRVSSEAIVSVDTFRAEIARRALAEGADIVNDISAGELDPAMAGVVAAARAPYIAMHMRGTPSTMQSLTDYGDCGGVVAAVISFLAEKFARLAEMGVNDLIADPGFGFPKTTDQNFELLKALPLICSTLQRPVLVGISRKSMFYKPLGLEPADVLPATTAAHLAALERGASILRVHDVGAAVQARFVAEKIREADATD